jgi:hypothetical protein
VFGQEGEEARGNVEGRNASAHDMANLRGAIRIQVGAPTHVSLPWFTTTRAPKSCQTEPEHSFFFLDVILRRKACMYILVQVGDSLWYSYGPSTSMCAFPRTILVSAHQNSRYRQYCSAQREYYSVEVRFPVLTHQLIILLRKGGPVNHHDGWYLD